ncbi:MAG: ATP-binding protein [Dehalococcoidia bacterium]|nr:ATP-binding protein [Dehalococcoidia bacterium]
MQTIELGRGVAENDRGSPPVVFAPQPQTVEETGLHSGLLLDLCIKCVYFAGRPTGRQIANHMALPFPIVEELLDFLKREQFTEVVGSAGAGEQQYKYALTVKGMEKAEEVLHRGQYNGPAPVSFEQYVDIQKRQSVRGLHISKEVITRELSHLILDETTLYAIGAAVNSGRSLLLYGNSGNGKSTAAATIGRMLPGQVLIPYAFEYNGHIIRVFDPRVHVEVPDDLLPDRRIAENGNHLAEGNERRRDRRWVKALRPVVMAGGSLSLQDLELRYSDVSKFYVAPLQVKANGGVLVIDDFGRQLIEPKELLNRWILPLEQGVDHLTLHTGDTIVIPFDLLLVFSTNLPPRQLGDEAFFRRIRHKIELPDPSQENFIRIFQQVCESKNIPSQDGTLDYLLEHHYINKGRGFRGCHPRDILELVESIANYRDEPPSLTRELVDLACSFYFVDL